MILNEIMKAITWDNGDTSPENIRRAIDANREHAFRETFSRRCINFKRWKDYLRAKGWVDMEYFMFMNGPNPDIMTIQQITSNNVRIEIFSDDEQRLEDLVDDIGLHPVVQPTRTEELIAVKEYASDITDGQWTYEYIGALFFEPGTSFKTSLTLNISGEIPIWYRGELDDGVIILLDINGKIEHNPYIHVYALYKEDVSWINLRQPISKTFTEVTVSNGENVRIVPNFLSQPKTELLEEARQMLNIETTKPPKEPKIFSPTPLEKRLSILERSKRISDFIKKIGY